MYRTALTAGILAAVGCLSLQAQTIHLTATIPFEFRLGQKTLPAGDDSIFHSAGVLRVVRDSGPAQSLVVLANPASAEPAGTANKLFFHRYGDEYFLAKVWRNGYFNGISVPPSKRKRELAASPQRATPSTIALAAK